jgi:hypothetical protein
LATLYIFGDESGTMPVDDADKPFVAATVAVLNNPPALVRGSEDDEKMVKIFTRLNVVPFVAMVKPFTGYGKALKAKHSKIQIMARATRLVTGAGAQHLDKKILASGFDLRNTVWCHAMGQAIANAVLSTLYTETIDTVRVILDRKTMTPSMRLLFKEIITNRIEMGLRQVLETLLPMARNTVIMWEDRIRFSSKTIFFNWSDDSEEFEQQFGLRLADRFARKIYQAQVTGQRNIETMLKNAGYNDFILDISKLVTHLDQRLIDNFIRNTGLPEPKEL